MVQTASLLGTRALGFEFGSAARLCKRLRSVWNYLWGHAQDLGSFVRFGYRFPVPDFCL